MAANSNARSPIWLQFKLIVAFIVVLVTCKNEEEPIKNEGVRVLISLYVNFSVVEFKLIIAFIVVLVICKYEEDPIKNEGDRVLTTFLSS